MSGVAWRWVPRDAPLPPCAAVAWHGLAGELHRHLSQAPEQRLRGLQAQAGEGFLIVTGPAEALPWLDGIEYAAPSPLAARLWLPTGWRADVCDELLAQALAADVPSCQTLLWRRPAARIALDRLLPLTQRLLETIEARWRCP